MTLRVLFLLINLAQPTTAFLQTTVNTQNYQRVTLPNHSNLFSVNQPTTPLSSENNLPKISPLLLLDTALSDDSDAAQRLLDQLSADRNESSSFGKNLLVLVNTETLPSWTIVRSLARTSRRARRRSLVRLLKLSSPFEETDDSSALYRRQSKVLTDLLRDIAESQPRGIPTVRALEVDARRDLRNPTDANNIKNRIPKNLETPKYQVEQSGEGGYEVRTYDPYSLVSVLMNQTPSNDSSETQAKLKAPNMSGASSFGALAGYLFGKNEKKLSMSMTTPVFKGEESDDSRMSFVLPSKYWKKDTVDTVPQPMVGSGVEIEHNAGGQRAVILFGGFAGKKDVERRSKQLLETVNRDKKWQVDPGASIVTAQYNDPFTPPWKRRNEVSIAVKPRT